jgi:indolepyruvate ferredoxin oxidoreductase beta subunit
VKSVGLLVTGVGGQGVVLASDIIGEAAMAAGYDVKKTDTLGMAQRGGSVVSHVRFGPKVWSPLIGEGEADLLLAFEKLEAARWTNYLRPGAAVIVNQHEQPPLAVNLGQEQYPSDQEVTRMLRARTDRIYYVAGNDRAREAGDVRALNTYMLGCASCFMPLKVRAWKDTIAQRLPERVREVNMIAFAAGRKEMTDACRQ